MTNSFRDSRFYKSIIITGAIICLVLIFWLGMDIVLNANWLQYDDFVEYWAAGSLNLSGGNPYDPEQLLPLQLETGRHFGVPVMMWNPPWMLLIAMPFSIFSYPVSRVLWILIFIIVMVVSINLTWQLYDGSPKYRWVGWVIGFTFLPYLEALKTGQTGPLLLLGMAGFLFFMNNKRFWLAGVFLSLLLVKPHILYLVLIAVALWSIYEKQLRVILGTGISLAFATFIVWVANPKVINQYFYAAANYPPQDWATPTIGGITRFLIGTEIFWMQFIPPLIGLLWLGIYWYQHRKTWDWTEHAPLVILVSIFTAAYGWTSDQTVSLIPILQVLILLLPINIRNNKHLYIICSYLLIEIVLLIPFGNQLWNFWLAPSLLIWYLLSKNSLKGQRPIFISQESNI